MQYITFETQDVQQVKYLLALNATGINFDGLGISEIDIQIALAAMPGLSIPVLTLTPQHKLDSTNVLIPLGAAVISLMASLSITVHGGDPAHVAQQVTLTNDFGANPLFALPQSALAAHASPAPST